MATKPDRNEIRRFLELVVGSVPDGHYALVWTLPSKRSHWTATIDDHLIETIAREAETENVYLGVGLSRHNMGETLRAKVDEISGIYGLWIDLDLKGPGHKKQNLPPTEEDALALLAEMGAEPSVVVRSGHGLQAWWIFREPWLFENDDERKAAASLSERWTKTLRLRAKAHGWDVDATHDLARVLRIAGTVNRKTVPDVPAGLLRESAAQYDSNDFEQWIQVGAETVDATTADLSWAFVVNRAAEPPAEKFALLCQYDPKFLETFNRRRPDFQDQSASSFDLALATRAMIAGWSAQEIVNLCIAFRRKHGGDPNKHQWDDYYRRTLNRAATGKTLELREKYAEDLDEGKPLPDDVQKDPAELLKIASKLLSRNPGDVNITKVLKYRGSPNTYELEVNEHSIRFGTIDALEDFRRFKKVILDSDIKKTLRKPSADTWERIQQLIVGCSQDVDAGPEATDRGILFHRLRSYLEDQVYEEDKFNEALEAYIPVTKGDEYYFSIEGLKKFIKQTFSEFVDEKGLPAQLIALKIGVKRIESPVAIRSRNGRKKGRRVWTVPKAAF